MRKFLKTKSWWIGVLLILVLINILASLFPVRFDLTEEKRFTLSQPTRKLLRGIQEPVSITVFLDGEMPAGFRKLANSSREILYEFRDLANGALQVKFERPGASLDDEQRLAFQSYIQDSLGLKPTNVKVTAAAGEAQEERLLYAGAYIQSGNRDLVVNLLEGQSLQGGYQTLNNAEALLEYRFASAIQKITADEVPVVGYLLGNGQPQTYNVYDLIEGTIKPNYGFSFLPIDSVPVIPSEFDLLVIMKPSLPFTDEQKLKLDQFVMYGGKLIWLVDNLYAEMDSLMRTQSDFLAFDRGLNLQDLLFRYGVRINQDLVQDLQSDRIPLVVGNFGNEPQMQLQPWPYFPVLSSYSGHPISKNLDNVLSIFPNSLDTIAVPGIKHTILLASSQNSRLLATPAVVSLNTVKTEDDLKTFRQGHIPIAVLIEGQFSSLYANRLSKAKADSLATLFNMPFQPASLAPNSMIVISDADIAGNVFTQSNGPMPMGFNQFTSYQYANKEFILNCIEYLVNPSGIMESRAKDLTLRMLDPKKVEAEKTGWQILNIVVPVVLIGLFGAIYQAVRKRSYRK